MEQDFLRGPVGRHFLQGFTGFQRFITGGGQGLVELSALGFPAEHIITDGFDDAARIACHQAAGRNLFTGFDEAERSDDTLVADDGLVHNDGIHADEDISANLGPMDDGPMADMGTFPQKYRDTGKHVDGTVFLHIAAVFNDDAAPVAPDSGTGPDIDIAADDDVAGDGRLRVNKSGRVNHWLEAFESIKHTDRVENPAAI
jgi:hypothetical protein